MLRMLGDYERLLRAMLMDLDISVSEIIMPAFVETKKEGPDARDNIRLDKNELFDFKFDEAG